MLVRCLYREIGLVGLQGSLDLSGRRLDLLLLGRVLDHILHRFHVNSEGRVLRHGLQLSLEVRVLHHLTVRRKRERVSRMRCSFRQTNRVIVTSETV